MQASLSIGEEGWTNNILIQHQRDKEIYYLPCYLRLKVKNFISVSIPSQEAEINADLLFTVYYGSLPELIRKQLAQGIILQFNRNDAVQLKKSIEISITRNQAAKTISFTVRKNLKCKIDCNFFWSPFEVIYLVLVVTIRSMIISKADLLNPVMIRFNLMDHQSRNIKISYTKEDSFGNYKLASKKLKVYYSRELFYDPEESNKEYQESNQLLTIEDQLYESAEHLQSQLDNHQDHQKLGYYQYAHFVIPMYKYPFISMFTIFFPMWSLSLYNLFMYYQGTDMSMRISNGATLILSLFAYIPTIREQLPDTPNILLVQILVYSIAFTLHLTLVQSYLVTKQDPLEYKMKWEGNIYFIISFFITLASVAILLVLSLLHKFYWERGYLDEPISVEERLNRTTWRNFDCDDYFRRHSCIKIFR